MKEVLVQITAKHFTAGLVVAGGKVRKAAPILRYMVGWSEGRALSYAAYRGWRWRRLNGSVKWEVIDSRLKAYVVEKEESREVRD